MKSIADILADAGIAVGNPDRDGNVKIRCPFHEDKRASCSVHLERDVFHCFACGAQGGAAAMAQQLGVSMRGSDSNAPAKKSPTKKQVATEPPPRLIPIERNFPRKHHELGAASAFWVYRTRKGTPYCVVLRFDPPDQPKEIRTIINTERGYQWTRPAERRLYNWHLYADNPAAELYFCEGEKAADACAEIIGDKGIAVTWIGGANGIGKVSNIAEDAAGRNITLWADNDEPGIAAMQKIVDIVAPTAKRIRWVIPPTDEKGDDAADALAAGITKLEFQTSPITVRRPEPKFAWFSPEEGDVTPIPMGYDSAYFYVWSKASCLIHRLKKGNAAMRDSLPAIAPMRFWREKFPKQGADFDPVGAVDWIMGECRNRGYFTQNNIRGRGLSRDGNGIVANLGDRLIYVEGRNIKAMPIRAQEGLKMAYRVGEPLEYRENSKPLAPEAIAAFERSLEALAWHHPNAPMMLTGWLISAIAGGALKWRPHCWISGATGSGKTWAMGNIINPILEGFCVKATAKTTEAGVRAALNGESIPVIFDEAESENKLEKARLQGVIDLARQASSDEGGRIIKGTMGGEGINVHEIHSCFLFASVNYGIDTPADRNRFLHLRLKRGSRPEKEFQEMARRITAMTADRDWVASFRAAAIFHSLDIVNNAEIFAQKISAIVGSRRVGDTVGSALAAVYTLRGGDIDCLIEDTDLSSDGVFESMEADDVGVIKTLFGKMLPGSINANLYQLVKFKKDAPDGGKTEDEEREEYRTRGILGGYGITVDGDEVYVSDNINIRENIFANSRWGSAWFDTIRQSSHINSGEKRKKVGDGITRRWVSISISTLDDIFE